MIASGTTASAADPRPKIEAAPAGVTRLLVILIRPSKYDDDGYIMRFFRGVLPSNTLAALAGLTREAAATGALGRLKVETLMLDEYVQPVDVRRLARRARRPDTRAVVALCGVQTNQFPRAADLAREFRAAGMQVMIGGFHVSGAIALSDYAAGGPLPPECQALLDDGVTLVKGEVENCWGDLLRDALHHRLRPFYDIADRPDIWSAAIPVVDPRLMKRYAYPFMGTIDAGRGCPFGCSFCTIINVQGRQMRCRNPEAIKERVRANAAHDIDYYFFTDDNFSRNPHWEAIFDALIALRREEGLQFQFMMQVDVLAYRIRRFMSKAAEAGCSQVFIGMESINTDNLDAAGKKQNLAVDYQEMFDAWHAFGIACHVGYIIGFPHDTVESVRADVRRLKELGADQASFFMLTPLPGSADHVNMARRGEWMDPDYNRFDSFHPVTEHPRMSREEWFEAYREAWREFYSLDNMKQILARANQRTYWGLFKNFMWYRYAAFVEETHPMICGFVRLKDRIHRRPGWPVESRRVHLRRRSGDMLRLARGIVRAYFDLQEVWLATRGRARWQENMDDLRRRYEELRERLGKSASEAQLALAARWDQSRELLQRTGHAAGDRWRRRRQWLHRVNPLVVHATTRQHLNAYWRQTWDKFRRGRWHRINPFKLGWNLLRDVKVCALFSLSFLQSLAR